MAVNKIIDIAKKLEAYKNTHKEFKLAYEAKEIPVEEYVMMATDIMNNIQTCENDIILHTKLIHTIRRKITYYKDDNDIYVSSEDAKWLDVETSGVINLDDYTSVYLVINKHFISYTNKGRPIWCSDLGKYITEVTINKNHYV